MSLPTEQQSEFQLIVDELRPRLANIGPRDWTKDGRPVDLLLVVILAVPGDELCQKIAAIIGSERLTAFYDGYMPDAGVGNVFGIFARLLPACCTAQADGTVVFDEARFLSALEQYAATVRSGTLDYLYVLHLTNIDISSEFELADGILFRKIPPENVLRLYPMEREFRYPMSEMFAEHWPKHGVEVVIKGHGTAAECQRRTEIKEQHATVNSIVHPFLLSGVAEECPPYVTHVSHLSVLEHSCMSHGMGGFSFQPHLLIDAEIARLREIYALLKDAERDSVMLTAIDRFILGKRQDTHHPNMVNEPNWDKVVDYVIAMETLFTTVEGKAAQGEPTYRFSVNGAPLVSLATGDGVHVAYKALKHLYGLRSAVVHGGGLRTVPDAANKFIRVLGIDNPNQQHSLGRLSLVCAKVEDWLRKVLFYLGKLPIVDRPFRKQGGWEELLWGCPSAPALTERKDVPDDANGE